MNRIKYVRAVVFLLLIACVSYGLSRVVMNKDGNYYKHEFFNASTDFDVLFIGPSRTHEGIDPIYLWENFGISSYNLASAGESIQVSYFVLKEALEHSNPKVIFVDASKISDEKHAINCGYGFVHESIDALPLNRNKLEAINYASQFFDGGQLAFLSNLYAYHDRIDDLKEEDFNLKVDYDKGAYLMTEVSKTAGPPVNLTDEVKELEGGDGVSFYKKIIGLCKEKGIKCVLVDMPVDADHFSLKYQKHVNALMKLTEESGEETMNLASDPKLVGIDFDHDFGDTVHLNFMGAAKVTEYIGNYLVNECAMTGHADDQEYSAAWDADIAKWKEQMIEMLSDKTEPVSYIFGTDPEETYCEVYMTDESDIEGHYALQYCFDKMGIKPEIVTEDDLGGLDMKIVVRSREDNRWLAEQYFVCNILDKSFEVHNP